MLVAGRAIGTATDEGEIELLDESTSALAANKLNSRFALAAGCEVPPALATKLDNVKIMVDTVQEPTSFG